MRRVTSESEKRARAYGGCLGSRRRGRTRQAAKVHGEARTALDPWVSEWGNPPCAGTASPLRGGEPDEPKHPSSRRKGKQQ